MDLLTISNTSYKTALLVKNRIEKNIDAADLIIEDRTGLRYFLTLLVPPYFNAPAIDWEELPAMEAVEEPLENIGGTIVGKGAFFDITNILKSLVITKAPDFKQVDILPVTEMLMPFRYKSRVENNGVLVGDESLSDTEYVIAGGINEFDFAAWGNDFVKVYIGEGKRFLTHAKQFMLLPGQQLYLYFLNNLQPAAQAYKLRAVRYFDDGSYDSIPFTVSVQTVSFMNAYCVPVGPAIVCGDALTGANKKVVNYQVWLVNEDNKRMSEIKTYGIDWTDYEETREVVFKNSLGGYDSICFTGYSTEVLNVIREVSEQIKESGSAGSFSEKVTNKVTGERELTLNTGWINEDMRKWLTELALSEDILLAGKNGFVKLTLMDESYTVHATEERLIGRTFVFRYAEVEYNFSDLPVRAVVSERPTGWRAYGSNVCLLDAYGKRTGKARPTHLEKYYIDDETAVKPRQVKLNVEGAEGYISSIDSEICAVTPFLNVLYSATGTFKKNDCANGYFGSAAVISIAAGRWGSEVSQADANAKAVAEWNSINTQAYANANGTCTLLIANGLRAKFWAYSYNPTGLPPTGVWNAAPAVQVVRPDFKLNRPVLDTLGLPENYLTARFTGYIKAPVTGMLTLTVASDDGTKFWFDGVLVVNDWLNHPTTETTVTVSVEANKYYAVMAEWFEFEGGEDYKVFWAYTGQAKIEIPTTALYYE